MIGIYICPVIVSTNPARPGLVRDLPVGTSVLAVMGNDTRSIFISKEDLSGLSQVSPLLVSALSDMDAAKEDLIVQVNEAGRVNKQRRDSISAQMAPLTALPSGATTYRAVLDHYIAQTDPGQNIETLIRKA